MISAIDFVKQELNPILSMLISDLQIMQSFPKTLNQQYKDQIQENIREVTKQIDSPLQLKKSQIDQLLPSPK